MLQYLEEEGVVKLGEFDIQVRAKGQTVAGHFIDCMIAHVAHTIAGTLCIHRIGYLHLPVRSCRRHCINEAVVPSNVSRQAVFGMQEDPVTAVQQQWATCIATY